MAETSIFPLFAPMQVEENPSGGYDYLMCLWREKNGEDHEFCAETCGDFFKFIAHLREEHGLDLKHRVDLCMDCEYIFQSRLDCIQHYLAKALSSQNFELRCEKDSDEADALKEWLKPIYWRLNADYKVIMDRVLFSDEMPSLQDYPNSVPNDEVDLTSDDLAMTQDFVDLGFDAVDEVDGGN